MSRQTFFYSESPYLQALQGLYKALSSREALVRLTGLPKTGKSALCEKLMLYMQHKNYRVVYFRYAVESPDMLRTLLARELNLPSAANFARMLEDVPQSGDGKSLILLFDDAHLLSFTTLLEIYRLMQVQSGAERKLNIVLCGEPLLDERLNRRTELKSLAMHISHNFMLPPMNNSEIAGFVVACMNKAGLPEIKLEPAALACFYRATSGLPGAARTLCNALAATQYGTEAKKQVSKAEILKLVREVQETSADALPTATDNRVSSPWAVLGPVAIVVLVASMSTLYQQLLGTPEVNSVTAVTETSTTVSDLDSPFAETSAASADDAIVEVTVPAIEQAIPAGVLASAAAANELAVISDSDLVLVTAAERGVAKNDIVEPVFDAVITGDAQPSPEAVIANPADSAASPSNSAQSFALDVAEPETENTVVAATGTHDVAQVVEAEVTGTDAVPVPSVEVQAEAEVEAVPETDIVAGIDRGTDTDLVDDTQVEVAAAAEIANPETASVEPATAVPLVEASTMDQVGINQIGIDQTDSSRESDEVEYTAAATAVIEFPNDSGQLPETATLEVDVRRWMAAWQKQDLENYFASYHPNFSPRYHPSKQRWQADRSRVISNARSIQLGMTEFEIIASTPQRIEVQFWLDYASATYKDSTQKKLILEEQNGRWLIVEEVNLQVRS